MLFFNCPHCSTTYVFAKPYAIKLHSGILGYFCKKCAIVIAQQYTQSNNKYKLTFKDAVFLMTQHLLEEHPTLSVPEATQQALETMSQTKESVEKLLNIVEPKQLEDMPPIPTEQKTN